ncbi:MAG: PD-(D/E)XK nuclease family protein [Planctomycetes bacterium]|nr:PD-(D/E)XK nuclease family protein [Planctomycetota bacterium]
MTRLTEQLGLICREHLLEEKWVVAPSLRAGRQWIESVARAGTPVLNARPRTLMNLALDLAGPEIAAANLAILSGRGGEILTGRIFDDLKQGGIQYLAKLDASPRLSEALFASIRSIRMAGLGPRTISPSAFRVTSKGREILQLLEAYLEELDASHRIDRAGVLQLAIERLRRDPAAALGAGVLVLVPEDLTEAHGLERALLEALPKSQRIDLSVDQRAGQTGTGEAVAQRPPYFSDVPPPRKDETVSIFRAWGEVNEVREALRRCLAAGIALDQVELLHTDAETYVPILYEVFTALFGGKEKDGEKDEAGKAKARRSGGQADNGLGLPVTFAEGIPCRYSRPGRALAGWLAWQRDAYRAAALESLVREGLLERPKAGEGEKARDKNDKEVTFSSLAAALSSLGIGFGRDRYLARLDEEIGALARPMNAPGVEDDEAEEDKKTRRERAKTRLERMQVLRAMVSGVLEITPAAGAGQTDILDCAARFLQSRVRCTGQVDNYARKKLLDEIEELQRILEGGKPPASLDMRGWLATLPTEARIFGSGPRPGCLHVAHALSGGHSGRPHTFIIGLDSRRFPGLGEQDPLVLDSERRALSKELPTAADRLERKRLEFVRLLARLRGTLTLSFSCLDLEGDRETFPSPVLLSIHRLISGKHDAEMSDFLASLLPAVSFAPPEADRALDSTEWWLGRLSGKEKVANPEGLSARCFPHLARGKEADRQRFGIDFTPYDGHVPQAGIDLDPTKPDGPVLSANSLQTLGTCPLRFFFRYALGLWPPEEIDETVWLDALQFGSLLHEIFHQFVREMVENRTWPPKFERDKPRILEILEEKASQYRSLYPAPNASLLESQMQQLRESARIFLKDEAHQASTNPDVRPAYLEASLGMEREGSGTEIDTDTSHPLPFRLPDGRCIRIKGRVDRIDRVGEGDGARTFRVWDYKSGSTYGYEQADPFKQGRILQSVLYMSVVERCLQKKFGGQARVERFGFFFPSQKGQGERLEWTAANLAEGQEIVGHLSQVVRQGVFLPTNEANDCKYCDYKGICGDVVAITRASQGKLLNPRNTELSPFVQLRPSEE